MFGNLFAQKKTDQTGETQATVTQEVADGQQQQVSVAASQSKQGGKQEQQNVSVSASKMDPALRQNLSALSHLDQRTTQVLQHAQEEAKRIRQALIEPDQILIGLLYDADIFKLLEDFSVDAAKLTRDIQAKEKVGTFTGQPTLSDSGRMVFEQAYRDAKTRGSAFVTPEDVLIALFADTLSTSQYLQAQNIRKDQVEERLSKSHGFAFGKKSVLEKYGVDLTNEAREGKLDPIAGREKEIDRLTHIMLRRTKNNPIIIGEAGVGKTAIVEGLAEAIASGKVPKDLQDKRIFQLDIASLVAGASHRGEFEERLRSVINEAIASGGKTILFIDEIHTIIGTGDQEGSLDASNILKPHLARGHMQIIGTTTTTEYRKRFEKDKAFARRFQPIICEEPSEESAIEMIKVLRSKYEAFHRVKVPDETIEAAVKLSKKYIGERYLPDKAVDLIDEAAADVKLKQSAGQSGDSTVVKKQIEEVVSNWTGIPITKLTEDESAKLLELEKRIHQRLIDQEEAVIAVSEAVRRGRIGLASGQRPIASFIFLGPSGVGKTELAKTLAEILFGRDDAMIRMDMSEYMEKHEVAKLIGAPPGYVGYEEGGQLTEAVRQKPYSIVLLDEVEKAHPDVFNILLQVLEDGRLTDNKGNTISFKNCILICTSNIGSAVIQDKLLGEGGKSLTPEDYTKQFAELTKLVGDELRKFFRPELLNRFDDIVIFKPLRKEDMIGVTKLGIDKTRKLLKEQGYGLDASEAALKQLSIEGYDPVYGARPLRRLIQTAIENPIALQIIGKKFSIGDTILIDYDTAKGAYMFAKSGGIAGATAQYATSEQMNQIQNVRQGIMNTQRTPQGDEKMITDLQQLAAQFAPTAPDIAQMLQAAAQAIQMQNMQQAQQYIDLVFQTIQQRSQQMQQSASSQQAVQTVAPRQSNGVNVPSTQSQQPAANAEQPPVVAATNFDPMSVLAPENVPDQSPMPQAAQPLMPQPISQVPTVPSDPAGPMGSTAGIGGYPPSYLQQQGGNGMAQQPIVNEQLPQSVMQSGQIAASTIGVLQEKGE